MIWLIYLAACWPIVSVLTAVILCRLIHNTKVRDEQVAARINGSIEA